MAAFSTTSGSSSVAGTVIAVAANGTRDKADFPSLPVSPEEVARTAVDCERIGAAILDLEPRADSTLAEVVTAVRDQSNLLVRVTAQAREDSMSTALEAAPDILMCPLSMPNDVVAEFQRRAWASGIAVQYELRAPEQLSALDAVAAPIHAVLIFGDEATDFPGDTSTFATTISRLPASASFSAVGLEEASLPIMLMALASGGDLRVGMGITQRYAQDTPVRDNSQLVARAAGLAKIAQRPPLSPAEANTVARQAE